MDNFVDYFVGCVPPIMFSSNDVIGDVTSVGQTNGFDAQTKSEK
jgi:hypothetical protein